MLKKAALTIIRLGYAAFSIWLAVAVLSQVGL